MFAFTKKGFQGTILLFRYAERDHEQLVVLCRQRAVMRQKLSKRSDQRQVVDLPVLEVAKPSHEEAIQIFVEMSASPKRTMVLMVRPSTTVREVKEMVEAKEGGIPVARQRLRTRGGKCLWQEELMLSEYGIGKEATLICSQPLPQPQLNQ